MPQRPYSQLWFVVGGALLVLVVAWPPDRGPSLLVKAVHGIVDPAGTLPALPPPLPPGLGDDGDAVADHDAIEAEYYRLYNSSALTRWRMQVKAADDPFGLDRTTARQVLVAALTAFVLYRTSRNS